MYDEDTANDMDSPGSLVGGLLRANNKEESDYLIDHSHIRADKLGELVPVLKQGVARKRDQFDHDKDILDRRFVQGSEKSLIRAEALVEVLAVCSENLVLAPNEAVDPTTGEFEPAESEGQPKYHFFEEDGMEGMVSPDGVIFARHPDGMMTIEYPGDKILYLMPDGGTKVLNLKQDP